MKGGKSGISGITAGTMISCWGGVGRRGDDWNDSGKIWKKFNSARFSRPQRNPGWKSALFQQFFPLSRSKIMQCNERVRSMRCSCPLALEQFSSNKCHKESQRSLKVARWHCLAAPQAPKLLLFPPITQKHTPQTIGLDAIFHWIRSKGLLSKKKCV